MFLILCLEILSFYLRVLHQRWRHWEKLLLLDSHGQSSSIGKHHHASSRRRKEERKKAHYIRRMSFVNNDVIWIEILPFLSQMPFSPHGEGLHGSWTHPVYGSPSYPGGQEHTALLPVDLHWAPVPHGEGTHGSVGIGCLSSCLRIPIAARPPPSLLLTTLGAWGADWEILIGQPSMVLLPGVWSQPAWHLGQ